MPGSSLTQPEPMKRRLRGAGVVVLQRAKFFYLF